MSELEVTRECQLLLTTTITMSDHNGDYNYDELRAPSQSSQRQQQEDPTMNPISLSALPDIPSSDLDLGSIIAPSDLDTPTPEQWAELDSKFRKREGC